MKLNLINEIWNLRISEIYKSLVGKTKKQIQVSKKLLCIKNSKEYLISHMNKYNNEFMKNYREWLQTTKMKLEADSKRVTNVEQKALPDPLTENEYENENYKFVLQEYKESHKLTPKLLINLGRPLYNFIPSKTDYLKMILDASKLTNDSFVKKKYKLKINQK